MNRVDVVDLVVDLVDVDLDIDLVDVDLDADLVDIVFVVLLMLPCGRPRPWKIVIFWKYTKFLFVDVALRAASTLTNRDFCIC